MLSSGGQASKEHALPRSCGWPRESSLRLESGATGAASDLRHNYERWLWIVLVLLGALLLLASLNVATLLLSRSEACHHEIATRLALGAGRWRIVRQLLTESIVLAVAAGSIGLLLSWWASRMLLRLAAPGHEQLPVDVSPDLRVVLFTLLVSSLTCLLFGAMPALRVTSSRRLTATRETGGDRHHRLLDRALVASQVAFSLMLIVAAGLFLRSLGNLWAQETGYDRDNVLMFSVDAHLAGHDDAEAVRLYQRLFHALRDITGAQSVSLSTVRPVSDSYYLVDRVTAVGDKTFPEGQGIRIAFNKTSPAYFSTLRIPIVAGRDFGDRDRGDSPPVAIISERMARHFTGSPVGQRIDVGGTMREVVGVAKDTRYASIKDAPREVVYLPVFQEESLSFTPSFEIRHAGPAADVLASIREAVARTEAGLTPFDVKTLKVQTEESLSRERLLAMLTSFVGGFALFLASIGIYGLMSSSVTQRTPELGVRMALGATPTAVQRLIISHCTAMVLAGALVGLIGSFVVGRLVQTQLYGLAPYDAATFAGAAGLLLAVAFGAAYLPALRASRIDPLQALRHD